MNKETTISYTKEILNCLYLSDLCYLPLDSTILSTLNDGKSIKHHDISHIISCFTEQTKQCYTIGFREKNNNHHRNTYYIVFKGTEFTNPSDIISDLYCFKQKNQEGTYHKGFHNRSKYIPIDLIVSWLSNGDNVIIGGHSLGGSVANVTLIELILSAKIDPITMEKYLNNGQLLSITFGAALIGDKELYRNLLNSRQLHNDIFHSFIHKDDPIPKLIGASKIINKHTWGLFTSSLCWLLKIDKSNAIDKISNFIEPIQNLKNNTTISTYIKLPTLDDFYSKFSLLTELDCLIGTYHVISDNPTPQIIQMSHLKDSTILVDLLNFKPENFINLESHFMLKYIEILEQVITSSGNGPKVITNKPTVKLFTQLYPVIQNVSISLDSKLLIIDGSNLCFITKLIINENSITSDSFKQKTLDQIVVDISSISPPTATNIIYNISNIKCKTNFKGDMEKFEINLINFTTRVDSNKNSMQNFKFTQIN